MIYLNRSQPTKEKVGSGPGNDERPECDGPAGMAPEGEIEVGFVCSLTCLFLLEVLFTCINSLLHSLD